jgi:hypothetical protein
VSPPFKRPGAFSTGRSRWRLGVNAPGRLIA